jgi:hypothetical protein
MCTVTKTLNRYPKKHGISIEALADMLGYESPSTLARHLNHNDHKRPFPLSKLIPIIRACGNDFEVLDHIETALGRVAILLPQKGGTITLKDLSRLVTVCMTAITTMTDAMVDGEIDDQERKDINREFSALMQEVGVNLGKVNK